MDVEVKRFQDVILKHSWFRSFQLLTEMFDRFLSGAFPCDVSCRFARWEISHEPSTIRAVNFHIFQIGWKFMREVFISQSLQYVSIAIVRMKMRRSLTWNNHTRISLSFAHLVHLINGNSSFLKGDQFKFSEFSCWVDISNCLLLWNLIHDSNLRMVTLE